MTFYKPLITKNRETRVIIYPEFGIEKVLDSNGKPVLNRNTEDSIESYFKKLIGSGKGVGPGGRMNTDWSDKNYMISFLWENEEKLFCDIWKMQYGWDSGPLAYPFIFGMEIESLDDVYENNKTMGAGSGNTLIVLGLEEQHRRKIDMELSNSFSHLKEEELRTLVNQQYFDKNNRPEIPFELVSDIDFHVKNQ